MIRTSLSRMLLLTLVVVIVTGCPATSVQRTPLQIAELTYAEGSLAYEFAQKVIKAAEAEGRVNDAQWSRYKEAEAIVQQYAPLVRSALDLWRASGTKPEVFDALAQKLANAQFDATAVRVEVQP